MGSTPFAYTLIINEVNMFGFGKNKEVKKPSEEIGGLIRDKFATSKLPKNTNMKLEVKKLHEKAVVPNYAHTTDAGLDLCFAVENGTDVIIEAGAKGLFDTGLAFAIPVGYVGLIWDKSGIAAKQGLKVMGGVIDSGYRGEVKVLLLNTSKERISIKNGQKVAQMLIQPVESPTVALVDELSAAEDERGVDGFGSTGV